MDELRGAVITEVNELKRLQGIRARVISSGLPVFRLLRLIFINHRIRKAVCTVDRLSHAYGASRP
jgi:hypothetical protein